MIKIICYSIFLLTMLCCVAAIVLQDMNIISVQTMWYFLFPGVSFISAYLVCINPSLWVWLEFFPLGGGLHSDGYFYGSEHAPQIGLFAGVLATIFVIVGLFDYVFQYCYKDETGVSYSLWGLSFLFGIAVVFLVYLLDVCVSNFKN